ncbi:MAG TPA: leucyl aminopeptidase family protein [Gammaproteobacteria bacterium]|nr:leucyl aminopeptidase family protein [Gammaproteobacteria bacterium]
MLNCFTTQHSKKVIPIVILTLEEFSSWLSKQNMFTKNWIRSVGFKAEAGITCLLPDLSGKLTQVLCGVSDIKNFWSVGNLSVTLPEGHYIFTSDLKNFVYTDFAMAWGLGAYQFSRYKKSSKKIAQLVLPKNFQPDLINNIVESIYYVRDLINTPTDDMGPSELAIAAKQLGKRYQAKFKEIAGNDLLKQNFHCIHTVGRASDDAPRLLDLRWGNKQHPKITLVGKGVCFDTGGLDLKPSSAMLLMKKDMAGAAHVLGLARMIMEAKLPINLRVLIPAVENAVAGNAYRPGDVIKSRKGLTVEIGNTDAEGRLVLADALTEAVSDQPDLLIDMSTLTGAARIAVGTDISAMFSNDDGLANHLVNCGIKESDPIWRLPLFDGYRDMLNSSVADINNCSPDAYAGAITAALFLKEFVPDEIPWAHFDIMAWNLRSRPGRPQGGEAMGLRALFNYLLERYPR